MRRYWQRIEERLAELLIHTSGISAVIFVFAILFFVLREGWPGLASGAVDLGQMLFSGDWRPTSPEGARYGTLALVVGTFSVTVVAMAIAVPLSLGAALFLSEFAPPAWRETLKVLIEILAAIPSVVWGFIGLMVMNPLIVQFTGAAIGLNVLNGGIILALMSAPIITSLSEDALKAVPDSYREAALAMGATQWQTAWRVLLPTARKGLAGAALLGLGRAVGESMAVLMATGHSVRYPNGLLDSVRTLTATIAAELGESAVGSEHYRALFLVGAQLLVITFAINWVASRLVRGGTK
ncbi:MAG: phosphate ABC transporter permease subunit PstC [Bryobacter sp.]|nr:phosphate ABC transporter permease subunit PstC [Bryobacter sp.]